MSLACPGNRTEDAAWRRQASPPLGVAPAFPHTTTVSKQVSSSRTRRGGGGSGALRYIVSTRVVQRTPCSIIYANVLIIIVRPERLRFNISVMYGNK